MHLDKPLYHQFVIFIGNVIKGDLGNDLFSNRSVLVILTEQLPFTIILAVTAIGWSALIGIPLGCLSAIKPNSILDRITGVISVGTIAIPSFLVSIWAILIFSIGLKWLPVIGAGEPGDLGDQIYHLILPAFAVGLGWVGYLARMVRASMLEVMGENYIRSANAFGLQSRTIIFKYALKVAILPTITLIGVGFGALLSGTVFAEIIFSRPGTSLNKVAAAPPQAMVILALGCWSIRCFNRPVDKIASPMRVDVIKRILMFTFIRVTKTLAKRTTLANDEKIHQLK